MTREELTTWALANGWQMIDGHPSLTKPAAPSMAIVRLVLKATVASLEIKKPAGKWEKVAGESYGKILPDDGTGIPGGLGLTTISGLTLLMQSNKDRLVFAKNGRRQTLNRMIQSAFPGYARIMFRRFGCCGKAPGRPACQARRRTVRD